MAQMRKFDPQMSNPNAADNMDNSISWFSGSSIVPSSPQPALQIRTQSLISMPVTAENSAYGYLPGDFWHTMDCYDVTMGINADVLGVSR